MHKEQLLYLLNSITTFCFNKLPRKQKSIKNILIVKLDEIGDMVYAIPVFDLVKQKFPEAKLTVYCKPAAAQLLVNQKSIDNIVHQLDKSKVDLWIELRGTFGTWWQSILAFPLVRLDRGSVRIKNKLAGGQQHELNTNLQVIKPLFTVSEFVSIQISTSPIIHLSNQNYNVIDAYLLKNKLDKFYLFHTGASVVERRWPIDRFADLAHRIDEKYGFSLILIGGPDEKEFIQNNLHLFPSSTYSLVGELSLTDLPVLASKAQFFIGNESGPIHIVSTSKIPIIGLYGPGVKDVFYPLGEKVKIIHHFLPKRHTQQTAENSTINKITVEEVWRELKQLVL